MRTGESEGIAPPPMQMANPALQRTGLGVPNRDVVSLLKQSQSQTPPPPNAGPYVLPSTPLPGGRIGTDTTGMNPIDRQQTLVDMMRNAPAGQKVRQRGDFIEELPPEQSPSRVKNALVGLLLGTAQGGLAGGIGGAALGAIKPEAVQQMLKDKHLAREQGELDEQIGTESKKAKLQDLILSPQIAMAKAQRESEYNDARIKIQQDAEAGRISRAKAEELQKDLDRRSREKIAADRIASREKIATMGGSRGQETEAAREKRERDASAAQAEYDQLISDEKNAGENKNKAYDYLAQLKNNPDVPKEDIAQATKAAEEADRLYQSYAGKKVEAQRKIRENTSTPQAQQYSGRTMSSANLERYARDKGLSLEDARKQVEGMGVRVQ